MKLLAEPVAMRAEKGVMQRRASVYLQLTLMNTTREQANMRTTRRTWV
jgi:hypothetical protein